MSNSIDYQVWRNGNPSFGSIAALDEDEAIAKLRAKYPTAEVSSDPVNEGQILVEIVPKAESDGFDGQFTKMYGKPFRWSGRKTPA
jgi:hypothetical protein